MSESQEAREGRAQSALEYYQSGCLGAETTRLSLRLLKYDEADIRLLMERYDPKKRRY